MQYAVISKRQLVLLISGPSGVGKTTLCNKMTSEFRSVSRVVTTTTREPRAGEIDGVDYHFLPDEFFLKSVADGEFLENSVVYGRHYGVQRSRVLEQLDSERDLIINLDVRGAEIFRRNFELLLPNHNLVDVFISISSIEELRSRLANRHTDTIETIERRMRVAVDELKAANMFTYSISSSDVESDWLCMKSIYIAEKLKNSKM